MLISVVWLVPVPVPVGVLVDVPGADAVPLAGVTGVEVLKKTGVVVPGLVLEATCTGVDAPGALKPPPDGPMKPPTPSGPGP